MTKPYPDYVKTNLDWFSEAPKHWSLIKVAWHLPFVTGWTPSTSQAEYFEGDNTWVSIEDMKSKVVSASKKNISDRAVADKGMPLVPEGSLLFSFKLSVGKVAFAGIDLYTNEAIAAFLPNDKVLLRFLYYAAPIFLPKYGQNNIYGSLLMNRERIEKARTFVPPIPEQKIIADYLDCEVRRIDELVSEKQNFINLLKEKRQALISHVVTKGLDPDVEMKDSGLLWAPKIPAHWSVKKLSYICRMQSGDSITSEGIEETGSYPVYGGNGVRGYCEQYNHHGDYILVGRQGSLCGNINYASGKFYASEHAVVVYPQKNVDMKWLGETLRIMDLIQYSVSAAIPGLSVSNILQLRAPYPPSTEQHRISEYIQSQTSFIDRLINEVHKSIELLKEHRSALISAAVTGKIDLRDKEVA